MKAWNKDGKPSDHPKPWGQHGIFSTMRIFPGNKIPFRSDHLHRLSESGKQLGLPWIPQTETINELIEEFISGMDAGHGLVRICIFEDIIGISSRKARSDGNPVEGWLIRYRRLKPGIKLTVEKELYGSLSELDVEKEDWIIIDPKENDLRESATSNIIFVQDNKLMIPDKRVLNGIVQQKLLPILQDNFFVTRSTPQDQDVTSFDEIILCGTGRGVAPLASLPELGWTSKQNDVFKIIRFHYEELIKSACD